MIRNPKIPDARIIQPRNDSIGFVGLVSLPDPGFISEPLSSDVPDAVELMVSWPILTDQEQAMTVNASNRVKTGQQSPSRWVRFNSILLTVFFLQNWRLSWSRTLSGIGKRVIIAAFAENRQTAGILKPQPISG
jgi:hypothetical protein